MTAVRIRNLNHTYRSNDVETPILKGVSLEIKSGEFVAIQGPSGSGKSTLLYLIGCLLKPQQGTVEISGRDISSLTNEELADLRNQKIGYVFQQFHLLPKANVLNNILMPTLYSKNSEKSGREIAKAQDFAKTLGLAERLTFFPNQLSGGQQQRVAIARALINDPTILLADEPTGNLDSKTAAQILDLFRTLNRETGKTVIIITHDNEVAKQCDRVISIKDGVVEGTTGGVETEVVAAPISRETEPRPRLGLGQYLRSIRNYFPTAVGNLGRNKARTALTMIGISVGVAAVLSMVTLGQFTKEKILAGYAEMGVNTLLFYGYPNWEQKATDVVPTPFRFFDWERDLQPLKRVFPQVRLMSPVLMGWDGAVNFGGRVIEQDVRVIGTTEDALAISSRQLLAGRNFVSADIDMKNPVCIIGFEIGQRLFADVQPLGQVLRVTQGNSSFGCRIIGVLKSTTSNKEWMKPNLQIYLPFTYFQALSGDWWASQVKQVMIQVDVNSDIEKTGKGIRAFFEQKYGKSGKFRVDSDSVLLAQMKRFLTLFTVLLAAIALVTLGVGGIGITNMMLVSVSERFREIGLRKAIGATDMSIRIQFLTESIAVCLFAGVFGLIVGFAGYHAAIWAATKFVSKLQFEWTVDWMALLLSVLSILLVGVLSGLFPALKAERLQVIEALRSE